MDIRDWYFIHGTKPQGPFSTDEILEKYKKGEIFSVTLVRHAELVGWVPFDQTKEFSQRGSQSSSTDKGSEAKHRESVVESDDHIEINPEFTDPLSNKSWPLAGPWIRFFARSLDVSIYFLLTYYLVLLVPGILLDFSSAVRSTYLGNFFPITPYFMANVVVTSALLILTGAIFGTSLGKFVAGISIIPITGKRKLSPAEFAIRELRVLVFGQVFYIPILGQIAAYFSKIYLRANGAAPYDIARYVVIDERRSSVGKFIVVMATLFLLFTPQSLIQFSGIPDPFEIVQRPAPFTWENPATGQTASVAAGWSYEFTEGDEAHISYIFTNIADRKRVVVASQEFVFTDLTGEYLVDLISDIRLKLSDGVQFRDPPHLADPSLPLWVLEGVRKSDDALVYVFTTYSDHHYWTVIYVDESGHESDPVADKLITELLSTMQNHPIRMSAISRLLRNAA